MTSDERPSCFGCGRLWEPWITTCPSCEFPIDTSIPALSEQVANPANTAKAWIDIPISNDEPAKLALLTRFFVLHEFEYQESHRLLSVPSSEARRLALSIRAWASNHDMPDDERHLDTLASTMREIGETVITAVAAVDPSAVRSGMAPASLDLR